MQAEGAAVIPRETIHAISEGVKHQARIWRTASILFKFNTIQKIFVSLYGESGELFHNSVILLPVCYPNMKNEPLSF